jgi:uncharacterized membrane protein YhaH (DUF805 family)
MSQALEGTPQRGTTLTEQANGRRIGRAMFIGHSVGYLVILAAVAIGLASAGFTAPGRYHAIFAVTSPPTVLDLPLMGLTPWVTLGIMVLGMLIWTDLTVRRRHDRGRSGVDAMIFQILLLASVIIHSFADAPDIVGWLDAVLVLFSLYLFVVLVLLPGNRGENAYGSDPRTN